jgi:hypothetical protein
MNFKTQHMCDTCFKIHFKTYVTQVTGSHIIYVVPSLIEFDSLLWRFAFIYARLITPP